MSSATATARHLTRVPSPPHRTAIPAPLAAKDVPAVPGQYKARDVIYRQGDAADRAFVIRHGRVRLTCKVGPKQRECLLALLGAGDTFGDILRPLGAVMEQSAIAASDVELMAVDSRDLRPMLDSDPVMATELIRGIASPSLVLRHRSDALSFRDAQACLAESVLLLADAHGERCTHGGDIDVKGVTQLDLADLIGTSRPFVSLIVNELKDAGLLGAAGHTLCVRDRAALKQRARRERSSDAV